MVRIGIYHIIKINIVNLRIKWWMNIFKQENRLYTINMIISRARRKTNQIKKEKIPIFPNSRDKD